MSTSDEFRRLGNSVVPKFKQKTPNCVFRSVSFFNDNEENQEEETLEGRMLCEESGEDEEMNDEGGDDVVMDTGGGEVESAREQKD